LYQGSYIERSPIIYTTEMSKPVAKSHVRMQFTVNLVN
jgi:hypothetical protein